MIIDYLTYKVAIASRETAQECYVSKGDGVMSMFTPDVLTILNINPNTFTFPSSNVRLSDKMNQTIVDWITNR